ncbi:MAG: hypothetical protein K2Z81_09405 [Cyanobacteria bacterium]|nr:hypothetical protein [Cyanobacteriota bacterium]
MQLKKLLPLPLLLLSFGFFSVSDASAQQVPCTVLRFSCRNQAYTNYLTVQGLPGFGANNTSVFASLDPKNANGKQRYAGYFLEPNVLQPPSMATGFRNFKAQIQASSNAANINDGRVYFTFQFASGPPVVYIKTFNDLDPKPAGPFAVKTIKANHNDFAGPDVRAANLVGVAIYITQTTQQSNFFLGKTDVKSGQGDYTVTSLEMTEAGCILP